MKPTADERKAAEQRFLEMAEAYAVLRVVEKREAYDKFFSSIPSSFRPKYDEKPIMELRNLMMLFVTVISVLQYAYWVHRRQQIIDHMMSNPQMRNKLAKATREGQTVKISGAEPADFTATFFFTIPMWPLYFFPWLYHICKWLLYQVALGHEQEPEEEKYWLMRQYGWSEQEYVEWYDKREAYYEAQGGKDQAMAQQEQRAQKMQRRMAKYEKYGR